MKEYKVIDISESIDRAESYLNEMAKKGWKVVCSYSQYKIILERDLK